MRPSIFVAATGQHVGKTTSTLGLVANLIEQGLDVGYCKPVGQKYLTINDIKADKDAVLFSEVLGFDLDPDLHSPVILGSGATSAYIDDPAAFDYPQRVQKAAQMLEAKHQFLVHEGTGHPGVGSVVDLSNAQTAKMLNAGVVMVVEGGIGRTIDKLALSMMFFKDQQVPVIGVIVNKVLPEKLEKVQYFLSKKLETYGLPLLGVLPFDKSLQHPIMETVRRAVNGRMILHGEYRYNRVEEIMSGSLIDMENFSSKENILLVVSLKRLDEAIRKIQEISEREGFEKSPLSGVIITGDGRHANHYDPSYLCHEYFNTHKIPVLTTTLDTLGSVVQISRIEVKINTKTPWKVKRAIELVKEHVNFDPILRAMEAPAGKTPPAS